MLEYFLFIIGFIFLVKGADLLVDGSAALAKKFGVSSLIIGLTIVAFGTSAPELIVNIIAALKGASDIALGNIIGSNVVNILIGLGLAGIIAQIRVKHTLTWREIPFAILSCLVLLVLSNKYLILGKPLFTLQKVDGIILLLFFSIFLYYLYYSTKLERNQDSNSSDIKTLSNLKMTTYIILGFAGLFYGGELVVKNAVQIAQALGVSDFLISATIIAVGTSLPELVTSIVAMFKKDADLAVGTIVGSNIFNVFFILGITALISPINVPQFINFDLIMLLITTVLLFTFMFIGQKHRLERWQGICFVLMYIFYIYVIVMRG